MYALRGQGCGIALLADADDPDYWTTQAEFGLQEGIYMILTGPAGDTIQNAVTVKQQAGLDSYCGKAHVRRLAVVVGPGQWQHPAGLAARLRRGTSGQSVTGAIEPEQAAVQCHRQPKVGHARFWPERFYSSADLAVLLSAGIDVICNPQPGGSFLGRARRPQFVLQCCGQW